jgi:hypothetical protein
MLGLPKKFIIAQHDESMACPTTCDNHSILQLKEFGKFRGSHKGQDDDVIFIPLVPVHSAHIHIPEERVGVVL